MTFVKGVTSESTQSNKLNFKKSNFENRQNRTTREHTCSMSEFQQNKTKKKKKRTMITISLLVLDLMISKSNYRKPRINVLATRIGTAATRPRVNTVGNVSTLEDRCGGNGDEWRLRRSDESSPPPELF